MKQVEREARRHGIKLQKLPTLQAIEVLNENLDKTNAILHVTCARDDRLLGDCRERNSCRMICSAVRGLSHTDAAFHHHGMLGRPFTWSRNERRRKDVHPHSRNEVQVRKSAGAC